MYSNILGIKIKYEILSAAGMFTLTKQQTIIKKNNIKPKFNFTD